MEDILALSQFHSFNTSPWGYITYLNMDELVKTFSFPAGGNPSSQAPRSALFPALSVTRQT